MILNTLFYGRGVHFYVGGAWLYEGGARLYTGGVRLYDREAGLYGAMIVVATATMTPAGQYMYRHEILCRHVCVILF